MSMSIDKVAVYQTAGWISGSTKQNKSQSKAKPKKTENKHKAKQSK